MRRNRNVWLWIAGALLLSVTWPRPLAAPAALTVTSTETAGQAWTTVGAGLMVAGTAIDVHAGYSKNLLIEGGYIEAGDSAGALLVVGISEDGANWVELTTRMTIADATITLDKINDASSTAGDAYVILDDAAGGSFDVINRQWLLYDPNTIANTEIVKTVSVSSNTITLAAVTTHNHPDNMLVYDRAWTYVIQLPAPTYWARVSCYNSDADIDCIYKVRPIMVSAL
jgi:hypothetical protein